jgi:hypothetical protein
MTTDRAALVARIREQESFLRNVVKAHGSYTEGWRELCQLLLDVLSLLTAEPERPETPATDDLLCPKCNGITVEHMLRHVKKLTIQRDKLLQGSQQACRHTFVRGIVDGGWGCDRCGLPLDWYCPPTPGPPTPEKDKP